MCNAQEADGATLDAHHIVFRSKSGRNDRRNLVTICRDCHQKQHRGFVIGADGGEPEGRDDASLEDGHDDDSPALETMPPVGRTEPQSPRAVPEIATHPEKVRMDSRASSVAIVDDIGGFGTPRTDVQRPP
ncbi:MAG: HNH endonuclease, partial [Dokdonella sp.]